MLFLSCLLCLTRCINWIVVKLRKLLALFDFCSYPLPLAYVVNVRKLIVVQLRKYLYLHVLSFSLIQLAAFATISHPVAAYRQRKLIMDVVALLFPDY